MVQIYLVVAGSWHSCLHVTTISASAGRFSGFHGYITFKQQCTSRFLEFYFIFLIYSSSEIFIKFYCILFWKESKYRSEISHKPDIWISTPEPVLTYSAKTVKFLTTPPLHIKIIGVHDSFWLHRNIDGQGWK